MHCTYSSTTWPFDRSASRLGSFNAVDSPIGYVDHLRLELECRESRVFQSGSGYRLYDHAEVVFTAEGFGLSVSSAQLLCNRFGGLGVWLCNGSCDSRKLSSYRECPGGTQLRKMAGCACFTDRSAGLTLVRYYCLTIAYR
ncbi:hypothetical protein NHH03_16370 [Stieleria sp. TO1_6]|uniref:hypothetical protein n=1 Tax=Stieleria tagensis TaxID=2956795 RepID=UPI00209BB3EA|nr:hypothetical protein [Stieleria tagensis]MCO8123326.1 hypothetical protein [Stieleria tagensis]